MSLGPQSSHSVINVLAPFDSYVKIPSREFFLLHFRFVLRFSTSSCCYYVPFFPHPVYAFHIKKEYQVQVLEDRHDDYLSAIAHQYISGKLKQTVLHSIQNTLLSNI
jgi:hypothetical protein